MTPSEFKEEVKRLIDFFGLSKYPEVIVVAMWKELGVLDQDMLGIQIDSFIQASTKLARPKAPSLEDFKIALFSQLNDMRRKTNDEMKKKFADCKDCKGGGVVPFFHRDELNYAPYSFQCSCVLGEKLYPSFPKQYLGMSKDYISHDEWYLKRSQLREAEGCADLKLASFNNNLHEHGGEQ